MFCLIAAGICQLLGANPENPIVAFFNAITSPPCRKISSLFPKLIVRTQTGYMDMSPVVLILFLGCVMIVIGKVELYFFK